MGIWVLGSTAQIESSAATLPEQHRLLLFVPGGGAGYHNSASAHTFRRVTTDARVAARVRFPACGWRRMVGRVRVERQTVAVARAVPSHGGRDVLRTTPTLPRDTPPRIPGSPAWKCMGGDVLVD